ncbi:uncharacterized protein [Pituophis catenifer annectens]|uniref:uncharacterized protein n=1 Tax=Pituophis catenifer annectens TaxID=94852 RepID=UPI003991DC81
MGYDMDRFVGHVNEGLICCICRGVLQDPLQAPCEHAFCTSCIYRWLLQHNSCPEDRQSLDLSVLRPLYRYMRNDLNQLQLHCTNKDRGCEIVCSLESIDSHECDCEYSQIPCPNNACPVQVERRNLYSHVASCEFRARECPNGCGYIILGPDDAQHNCVAELRTELELLSTVKIAMPQKAQLPVDSQSQEASFRELKEFIKEAINKQMDNLTVIMDGKLKQFTEDINAMLTDVVEEKHNEIDDIILAASGLTKHLVQLEERVEEINDANLNLENKVGEMMTKTEEVDDELVMLQYRSMEFALRLRGLKENSRENLKDICANAIAEIIKERSEDVAIQIDKIYRVNSWMARQRQLPRDVVIYFTTRRIRNDILQASYKNKIQVDGQELVVLKEIPPKMLRARKDFGFLVNELRNQQVQYRWDVPKGLIVTYGGQRHRLNTVWKAKDFYVNVLKAGYPPSPGGGRKKMEMIQLEKDGKQIQTYAEAAAGGITTEEDLLQSGGPSPTLEPSKKIEEPREQRMTRATYKRQEQQLKVQQSQVSSQEFKKTEAVGGARPKSKMEDELQLMLSKLRGAKDGN